MKKISTRAGRSWGSFKAYEAGIEVFDLIRKVTTTTDQGATADCAGATGAKGSINDLGRIALLEKHQVWIDAEL